MCLSGQKFKFETFSWAQANSLSSLLPYGVYNQRSISVKSQVHYKNDYKECLMIEIKALPAKQWKNCKF